MEAEELRALAAAGRLGPEDLVWKPGLAAWVAARSVRGLFAAPLPPPLPAMPGAAAPATGAAAGSAAGAETDVWRGRPSQVVNLPVFLVAIAACWLLVPVAVAVWRFLVIRCTGYEVTTQRLRRTWGVIARHSDELELYRVKDTTLTQSPLLRLFRLGDIVLDTSDVSSPRWVIRAVPIERARALRETLRGLVEGLRGRKGVREIDAT